MDRYLLVLNVGTSLHSMTARQRHAEVLALTEEVPASLFPFFPVPPAKDFWLCVKGCSFKAAATRLPTSSLGSFVPGAHMHAHTGYHCGLYRLPLSCPGYYLH